MNYDEYSEIRAKVIENLKSRYLEVDDNVVFVDRLFLAIGVVNHVIDKYRDGEMDDQAMIPYFKAIEKFLDGEIEIFWDDGQLKFKRTAVQNYTARMQKLIDKWKEAASEIEQE